MVEKGANIQADPDNVAIDEETILPPLASVIVETANSQAGPEDHVDLKMVREKIVLNIL